MKGTDWIIIETGERYPRRRDAESEAQDYADADGAFYHIERADGRQGAEVAPRAAIAR